MFILLERLIREPKRYQDLLEFLFLCFSLGFRGRYRVAAQDQGSLNRYIAACITFCISFVAMRLFRCCIRIKTQGGRYQLIKRLTIRHIFCGGIVVLALFYFFICCGWTARRRIFCIN